MKSFLEFSKKMKKKSSKEVMERRKLCGKNEGRFKGLMEGGSG